MNTEEYCRKFLEPCNGAADIEVNVSEEDIKLWKKDTADYPDSWQQALRNLPDSEYEIIVMLHKLSEQLIEDNVLMMHGAVVAVDGDAYLFTATSGTGKSTHISFWKELLGNDAVIVNGDKPFIRITEDEAIVYGSPWCGKEGWNTNTSARLKAICVFDRGKENLIRKITPAEALPSLLGQILRSDDREKDMKVLNLISRLTDRVEFYHLQCLPNPEAAELAYDFMRNKEVE